MRSSGPPSSSDESTSSSNTDCETAALTGRPHAQAASNHTSAGGVRVGSSARHAWFRRLLSGSLGPGCRNALYCLVFTVVAVFVASLVAAGETGGVVVALEREEIADEVRLPQSPPPAEAIRMREVVAILLQSSKMPDGVGFWGVEEVSLAFDGVAHFLLQSEISGWRESCGCSAASEQAESRGSDPLFGLAGEATCQWISLFSEASARARLSVDDSVCRRVVAATDVNGDGLLSSEELSTLVEGLTTSIEARERFVFDVSDGDMGGSVTAAEFSVLASLLLRAMIDFLWQLVDAVGEVTPMWLPAGATVVLHNSELKTDSGALPLTSFAEFYQSSPLFQDATLARAISTKVWTAVYHWPTLASWLQVLRNEALGVRQTFPRLAFRSPVGVDYELFRRQLETWAWGGPNGGTVPRMAAQVTLEALRVASTLTLRYLTSVPLPMSFDGEDQSEPTSSASLQQLLGESREGSSASAAVLSSAIATGGRVAKRVMPPFSRSSFDLLDRNSDRGISLSEMENFLNLTNGFTSEATARMQITAPPEHPSPSELLSADRFVEDTLYWIFSYVDGDGDGRIQVDDVVGKTRWTSTLPRSATDTACALADVGSRTVRTFQVGAHSALRVISDVIAATLPQRVAATLPDRPGDTVRGPDRDRDGSVTWEEAKSWFDVLRPDDR